MYGAELTRPTRSLSRMLLDPMSNAYGNSRLAPFEPV